MTGGHDKHHPWQRYTQRPIRNHNKALLGMIIIGFTILEVMDLRPTLSLRVFFVLDNSSTWDIPWVKYTDSSRFATIGIHCLWHWLQHCRTSHGSQVSYGACGRHALGQGRARNGLRLITGWWFQNVSNMNFIFHNKWECDHPNWRTHIFQRGGSTTNQTRSINWGRN